MTDLLEVVTGETSSCVCQPEGLSLSPEPDGLSIGAPSKEKKIRENTYESAELSYLYYFIILLLTAV